MPRTFDRSDDRSEERFREALDRFDRRFAEAVRQQTLTLVLSQAALLAVIAALAIGLR